MYYGDFSKDLFHGKGRQIDYCFFSFILNKGTIFYPNGGWYEGDFKDGKYHGKGNESILMKLYYFSKEIF